MTKPLFKGTTAKESFCTPNKGLRRRNKSTHVPSERFPTFMEVDRGLVEFSSQNRTVSCLLPTSKSFTVALRDSSCHPMFVRLPCAWGPLCAPGFSGDPGRAWTVGPGVCQDVRAFLAPLHKTVLGPRRRSGVGEP